MEPLFSPEQISRFYDGWSESNVHREWTGLWRKQFKACTCIDSFIASIGRGADSASQRLGRSAKGNVPALWATRYFL